MWNSKNYFLPVRILDSKGRELKNSATVTKVLSVTDANSVTFDDEIFIDFGRYLSGYYEQHGGHITACGDFCKATCYPLKNGQWGAFRYVKVTGTISFSGIRIAPEKAFYAPGFNAGEKFSCSDKLLNEVWEGAVATTQACTLRHRETVGDYEFADSPRRDRRLFLWFDSAGNETFYYAFGNTAPGKSSCQYLLQHTVAGGFPVRDTPCENSYDVSGFTEADILEIYNFDGDLEFLKKFYPEPVNTHMRCWVLPRRSDNGLYKCSLALPVGPGFETSLSNQAYVYRGLLAAAEIATVFEDEENRRSYTQLAAELKTAVDRYLWSPAKGVYRFSEHANHADQLGNALAVVFGLAGDKAPQILEYLKNHHWRLYDWKQANPDWEGINPAGSADFDRPWLPGDRDLPDNFSNWGWTNDPDDFSRCGTYNYCISPWMNAWEIEAHCLAGSAVDALALTRRCFGNMLKAGPGTFWEQANYLGVPGALVSNPGTRIRTSCHRWSAKIGSVLLKYLLGIGAASPGFKRISVVPHCGELSWAKGKIDTTYGPVEVEWHKTKNLFRESIIVASECSVTIGIPKPFKQIHLNRKPVSLNGNSRYLEDEQYFYLHDLKGPHINVEAVT